MYGTVARMKVKPGKIDDMLKASVNQVNERRPKGYLGEIIYKLDENPNEIVLCVFFDSKESYHANANDPAQDKDYKGMRELLEADPDWNDGEVIHQFWVKQ